MATIRFDHVSKQFTLHRQRSRSFQELFLNRLRLRTRPVKEHMWALRDVSLTVEPGEMVGIIGPNGAGKSTLLKLVSRIVEPTSGQIQVCGRVGALLELGTGFHPDLTGRENIYLNGSIVGLGRNRIDQILDDIIAFSELEQFIDVPVKHYSSGMYMRLGFSIAIHIQPDILLVDEVLAVGDHSFQLRCLDRVYDLKRQGVSIVLVTHNLETVRELADRAIWLDAGQVRAEGQVDQVVEQYMTHVFMEDEQHLLSGQRGTAGEPAPASSGAKVATSWRWGSGEGEIVAVQLLDGEGQERRTFRTGETFVVRLHYHARQRIDTPQFGLALYHSGGFHISGPNTTFAGLEIDAIEGRGTVDYRVDSLPLLEGTYLLSVSLYNQEGTYAYDHHHLAYTFRVRPDSGVTERYGAVLIPATWRLGPPSQGAP